MNQERWIRKGVIYILLILLLGGVGGILMDRLVLPYLATIPFLKSLPLLSPRTPLVITRREEIRINEGINHQEILNRVKHTLATVYLHEGEFGTNKFRLLGTTSGVVVSSDGIIITPLPNFRPELSVTLLLASQEIYKGRVLQSDALTGVSFLKIEARDLPVIKQGTGQETQVGERLIAVRTESSPVNLSLRSVIATAKSLPMPSLTRVYELGRPNAFLPTDQHFDSDELGAVVVNKDSTLVGFVTALGKDIVVLRAEDLQMLLNNFLDDQRVVWPAAKLSYEILGESETKLLGLLKKNGILIKSAVSPLRENDFVYAVDDQDLTVERGFQQILLSKKPGGIVKLKLIRASKEIEVAFKL